MANSAPAQRGAYTRPCVGLILAGGGARAAYQVGVLKAIAELAPRPAPNPFPIICGTSAGAINAAALAIHADRFALGVHRLNRVWRNFHTGQVFRSDAPGIIASGAHWLATMLLGGLGQYNPLSLFDCSPLGVLIDSYLDLGRVQHCIDGGHLRAFSVTACGYTSGQSVVFYEGHPSLQPWKRARRIGIPTKITRDHVLASSAIPFVFPAVKINREYFGDGSMRQIAPISPALHLGADRIMVVGVRRDADGEPERLKVQSYPSLAQVAGYVLDSIFLDSLEADLERLQRINKTIALIPTHHLEEGQVTLRKVDVLVIAPSEDLQLIAARHMQELPLPVRTLLRGVGAIKKSGSNLVSYLLFERGYTRDLIRLGHKDTMARREEVAKFLGFPGSSDAA